MNALTKVLLVYPNFNYFPGWLQNKLNYKQIPLGLLYLASFIRSKYSVDIRICDASFLDIAEKDVIQYITAFKPDIVGMSIYTPTVGFCRNIALETKRLLPESLIVFGGPHATALPFENLDVADICVLGEGEITFGEVVKSFIEKSSYTKINGVSLKKDKQCLLTPARELIEDLDILPFPARDLYSRNIYQHIYPYQLGNPFYSAVVTSRGCAFDCNFCSNNLMWKRQVRYRSLDNIFEEIEGVVKNYNISFLRIGDDNFIANSGLVIDFCRRNKKLFPDLKWLCHARADALTQELIGEMKEGGCAEVQIGVESGDDQILRNCNKMSTTAIVYDAIRMLRKNKINVWATFIIGNEGDSRISIEKTIKFAKKVDPTYCSFMFLSPLPGTNSYLSMSKKGYIKAKDWSEFNWHGAPVFETEELTKELLMSLRKRAYRDFYLRPKIMFRYVCAALRSRQWKTIFADLLLLLKFIFGFIK